MSVSFKRLLSSADEPPVRWKENAVTRFCGVAGKALSPAYPAETFSSVGPHWDSEVNFLRICAAHEDKAFLARYIREEDGIYRFAYTIPCDSLPSNYAAEVIRETRILKLHEVAKERCPYGGGIGYGAIKCGKCGRLVDWCRTSQHTWLDSGYFRCTRSCGGDGRLAGTNYEQVIVVPAR